MPSILSASLLAGLLGQSSAWQDDQCPDGSCPDQGGTKSSMLLQLGNSRKKEIISGAALNYLNYDEDHAIDDCAGNAVRGQVTGLEAGHPLVVSLGTSTSDKFLETTTVAADGSFEIQGFQGNGTRYWLKYEGKNYPTAPSEERTFAGCDEVWNVDWQLVQPRLALLQEKTGSFHFKWQIDASRAGFVTEVSNIVEPPVLEFGEKIPQELPDDPAAPKLLFEFGVVLNGAWPAEFGFRLLDTLRAMPLKRGARSFYDEFELGNAPLRSSWTLSDRHIKDDVEMTKPAGNELFHVTISRRTFTYAHPEMVVLDGTPGKFFSKRLHHAVVRFVTNEGKDYDAVEHIFETRFGCQTVVSDAKIDALIAPTTAGANDTASRFQPWSKHPEEALLMLTMFEELPQGLHIVKGMSYIVRRQDGMTHPLYPASPAVAWPTAHEKSYLEFMESGFKADIAHLRRLVLHEKAHFMWSNVFDDNIRNDWIELGGWFIDPKKKQPGGWSTHNQLQFVTAYAHKKNPNEHMAESISYYVENPNRLLACCPNQFDFIRDRVMHGSRYIPQLPEGFTFTVLNLAPDYNYPGRIISVDIDVLGEPEEDKTVTVAIKLHTAGGIFDGARYASFRVFSTIGTFQDVWLYQVGGSASHLSNTFTISKHAKAGHWMTDQIKIWDTVGNQRFAGSNDYGWKMLIDNPLEDLANPEYVKDTLELRVRTDQREGHDVQVVSATWLLFEDSRMGQWGGVHASMTTDKTGVGSLQNYGYPGLSMPDSPDDCGAQNHKGFNCERATIDFVMTEFRTPGTYWVPQVKMTDIAGNEVSTFFSDGSDDEPKVSKDLSFSNPDSVAPVLDLDSISVSASPTQPEAPNGETKITIIFSVSDDKSGLGSVNYRLLDPQGGSHFNYFYHPNTHTLFFSGDPTEKKEYTINVVLPVGSPPGEWGLQSMELSDKVDNQARHSFAELLHFEADVSLVAVGTKLPLGSHLRFKVL